MTSKSLLSADTASVPAREMRKHMLWSEGLTFLIYFLYHVVGIAVALTSVGRSSENASPGTYGLILLGPASPVIYLTFVVACVLAFHGFCYLTDRRALDFYESQPISRRRHFLDVCRHSLTVFGVSFLTTMAAGAVVAAAMGAFPSGMLPAIAQNIACNFCFFFAVYGICVLAVMLTGNILVSLLAGCVLFLYEAFFRMIIDLLMREYFATFAAEDWLIAKTWTTPFLYLGDPVPFCLHNIVLGAIAFALACLCYRIRRNEDAGKAVLFRPVRAVVKIAIAMLPALFVGFFLSETAGVTIACLCAALAAVITGCAMEIIYAYDFKALFRHLPETLIAAAMGIGILFLFIKDPMGYDRYVPEPSEVESAAVLLDDYYTQCYVMENGVLTPKDQGEYSAEYMYLTDTKAVTELARSLIGREEESSNRITLVYRLRNGREVRRRYPFYADSDEALMDRIVGTEQFREGYFQVCQDSVAGTFAKDGKVMLMYDESAWKEASYSEFREAYLKDLEQFSYTFARDHSVLGMVTVANYDGFTQNSHLGVSADMFECPVFSGFENTIAFLKKYGLYKEPVGTEEIQKLTIRIYDSGDLTDDPEVLAEIEQGGGVYRDGALEYEITDPAVIAQIFPDGLSQWADGPLQGYFRADKYMETEAVLYNGDTDIGYPNIQNLPEGIRKLVSSW